MGGSPADHLAQLLCSLRVCARTLTDGTAGNDPARSGAGQRGRPAESEQPLGALLLEVQRAGGRRLDPPDAPAELGHVGPDPGIGEYPDAEGKRNRADVISSLQRDAKRDGGKVRIGELPVQARHRRASGSRGSLHAGTRGGGPPGGRPTSAEPPAGGPSGGGPADSVPQRRQQPERLPVPEHPRGHIESASRLGDAHEG